MTIYIHKKYKRKIGKYLYSLQELIENKKLFYILINYKEFYNSQAIKSCCELGNLYALKLLIHKNKEKIFFNPINYASLNGHLNIVKWLHKNRSEGCTTGAMNWASENGHTEIYNYLIKHKDELLKIEK